MTDAEVRAELERIDPDYSYTWDLHTKEMVCDGCPVEKALRLLAESQQALREIYKKTKRIIGPPSDGPYNFDDDCKTCVEVEEIARTHYKGGS